MISLKKVSNEFDVPKIRESFMRQFLGDNEFLDENVDTSDDLAEKESIVKASFRSSKYGSKSRPVSNLTCIVENPSDSGATNLSSKTLINLNELNSSNLFRPRKITTPNANAVQLRVLNNIRMQRACRFSIKKLAIANIVKSSNSQRLFNEESTQVATAGFNDTKTKSFKQGKEKSVHKVSRNRDKSKHLNGNVPGVKLTAVNKTNPVLINIDAGRSGVGNDIDFKRFQLKKQQAELKRNQLEDDLKENHPYFDKPLFTIGRESNFRKFCQMIVEARYTRIKVQKDQNSGAIVQDRYKQFYKIVGLVSYLDWLMIAVTIQSCIGMMFETPNRRLVETWQLKIVEYLFIFFMSIEMTLKVCAYGLFFTPNAVVKDFGGILDLFIFSVSLVFIYLSPEQVMANSGAQMLMLLRCLRPLRIFTLVPHMRKVIYELCRGSKEILLVSILLVVLIFIFANYGIQIFGGKLARCNDESIQERKYCTGLYKRNLFVSKLKLGRKNNSTTPSIWVPRVWANPYNFNFDSIGSSMLALFEVLSLEGWLEVRDIIIERMGSVSIRQTEDLYQLLNINSTNYDKNVLQK